MENAENNAKSSTPSEIEEEVVLRNGRSRKHCRVLFSYEPCHEDELRLVPQDLIEFLEEVEEGWYRGSHRGVVGVFPSNFVTEEVELCKVLFSYEAVNDDELSLQEGDIITLITKDALDKVRKFTSR